MIEYPDQERDKLRVPFDPTDDILLFGNNAPLLVQIRGLLYQLVAASRRGEIPNPSIINISAGRISTTTVRYRTLWLYVSDSVTERLSLRFGSANQFNINISANVPVVLPVPLILDTGTDVSMILTTGAAGTTHDAYLVAYPELEVPTT